MQFNGLDTIRNASLNPGDNTLESRQDSPVLTDDERDGDSQITSSPDTEAAGIGATQSLHMAVLYSTQTQDSQTQESSLDQPTSTEADGWHISAVNADQVWPDYTGSGVVTSVIDNGFVSYDHPDFDDNIRSDLADPDAENGKEHGTNTLGLIGAEANGSQVVGIAYDADMVPMEWTGDGIRGSTSFADVMNNSWGFTTAFNDFAVPTVADTVANGRDGLGSVVVFSAGNSRQDDIGSNIFGLQSSSDTITVAATDTSGDEASFSSFGSSVLVTAPGVQLSTTDGASGTTDFFAGTSGSAPIVSGVSTLVLEANPDLGYRDVQKILALSTQHNDSGDSSWMFNGTDNWNGGGMHFSPDHGFGMVDARAAVRLAETWEGQRTAGNEVTISAGKTPDSTIPDNGSAITSTLDMSGKQNVQIETVDITVDVDNHGQVGDLVLTLTSPDGTEATLLDTLMDGDAQKYESSTKDYTGADIASFDHTFGAQNFRGETSAGEWTLQVRDVAGGNQGLLSDWSLMINGESVNNSDTYFFSDDFGTLSGRDTVFNDTNGGTDTINAAMVTSDTTLDLGAGTGTIAGKTIAVDNIEDIHAGDGNDTLTGDAGVNHITGGRGDDTVHATEGDDTLDGGRGEDTVHYNTVLDDFFVDVIASATIELTDQVGSFGFDTLLNFETFTFSGTYYSFDELEAEAGAIDIPIEFIDDDSTSYFTSSQTTGTKTLTSEDLSFTGTNGDAVTIDRDTQGMTVTIEDGEIPGKVDFAGTDNNDDLTLNGTHSDMTAFIQGKAGDDTIDINSVSGPDKINAGDGSDTVHSGAGADRLFGGNGDDTLYGEAGNDELYGMANTDTLNGGSGVDNLYGGSGDDTLDGGAGFDRIKGEGGNDTIIGSAGEDKINGGDGIDTLVFDNATSSVTVRLDKNWIKDDGQGAHDNVWDVENVDGTEYSDKLVGNAGVNTLKGGGGQDNLFGRGGGDTLEGGTGFDRLHGEAGNDTLRGGSGDDKLSGGSGDDTLYGDEGENRLLGNDGADTFAWDNQTHDTNNIDRIGDFDAGEGDKLDISDILTGFDDQSSDITNFLQFDAPAPDGDVSMAVDRDGTDSNHSTGYVAQLDTGGQALDAQNLYDNGNVIA